MAQLLMIESWVGASGRLLPPLIKSLGHSYTFITRKQSHYENPHDDNQHPVLKFADEVIEVETNDVEKIMEVLVEKKFDGVITVCDYYIDIVREVANRLNIPCPFPLQVEEIRRKDTLRKMLDKAGIKNPKYYLAESLEDAIKGSETVGFPLVLKPVDLASSAFVKLIYTTQELEKACEELESFPLNFRDQPRSMSFLLEEYMSDPEVSVETVSYNGEITVIGITDKSVTGEPYFIENGHMFPADLKEEVTKTLKSYVEETLRKVGYNHGVAHTEIKLTKDGFRVVEINPRIAGNYIVELIANVVGVNMLEAFVDLAIGKKPRVEIKDTGIKSSAIMFYVPSKSGVIEEIQGLDTLNQNPNIIRYNIENCVGKSVDSAIDNACYLAHVVTKDMEGMRAREFAETALESIHFKICHREI